MSTDITPGQIWKDRDDNARLRVDAIYPTRVGFTWMTTGAATSEYVDEFLSRFVLDAPAPLDPSKVAITLKRDDYIEAESDGAKIGGKVSHVNENGFVAIEHLGTFAIHHITPSPLPDGYRMFLLTSHQPAPEPEPGWKPGGVFVTATVDEVRKQGVLTDHNTFLYPGIDRGYFESHTFTDVRPLVVLDPAVARKALEDNGWGEHETNEILHELRIEASS